jgi:hypothetical protein
MNSPVQQPAAAGKLTNPGSTPALVRSYMLGCLVSLVALGATIVVICATADTAAAASGSWSAETLAPTYFVPGKASAFSVTATDTAAAGDITIKDTLPAGVQVKSIMLNWSKFGLKTNLNGGESFCPKPTGREVTCELPVSSFGLSIEPGQEVRAVINVEVPVSTPEGPVSNEAVVEGGGPASASTSAQITISSHPSFGFVSATLQPTEATRLTHSSEGANYYNVVNEPYKQPFTQAGGHPWALTNTFEFTTEATGAANSESEIDLVPTRDPRDIANLLPPGLLGDPLAVPRCSLTLVTSGGRCPGDTQIGVYRIRHNGVKELLGPIVNVTPEAGQSAEFALENQEHILTPLLTAHLVRTHEIVGGHVREGYGFDVADNGVPEIGLKRVELTFWGVPAEASHDAMRGLFCGKALLNEHLFCLAQPGSPYPGGEVSNQPLVVFASLPTDCSEGRQGFTQTADSWQEPGVYADKTGPFPAVTGCNLLAFNAGTGVKVEPDTLAPDEPVGLGVNLKIPLNESPETNTTPAIRDTTVTLPEGMSVSPGVVDGVQACNATGPEGINITGPESEEVSKLTGEVVLAPGHCPDASIVGAAEAITPFLPTPVKGHVYLARPGCGGAGQSPCTEQDVRDGNLYKLYLEFGGTGQFADTGIQFKVPLETQVNPATGQLTAVSKELLQTLYSEVKIHLNGGPRAPLANPAVCGRATTTADFTPWSAPGLTPEGLSVAGSQDVLSSSLFEVEPHGCPNPAPFAPGFTADTVIPQAGQYSAFTMNLSRSDREQYLKGIQLHTPPGLLGMLSNVPLCPENQANDPSAYGQCTASKIGTTRVATGAGSHPFEIEGNVYLTGPYRGAPFGLSIVTNAVAGPFNLGLVVVRARIAVDPETSELTVTTDESGPYALPQIIFGVPLRLQRVTVNIDRPGFMFNPTNCAAQQITATLSGNQNAVASVSAPFAVGGCASLAFKPRFTVSTSGKTSRAGGASLDAKVTYPPFKAGSESNIASVKVDLPKQLPSRLTTLQKACTAAQFTVNAAGCPPASIVGIAKASTPLLPVGLEGPVYFVSHGGEAFPSLIVVLQGDGVRVDLTGTTFISRAGITSSTFKTVPDVPVNSFELYLPEGKYSALAANGTLCTSKLTMPTEFVAQNGATLKQSTKIAVTHCPKAKKAKKTRKKNKTKAKKARNTGHGRTSK